uniref:RRM domain-containing protein n=1 Tax=Setaria digitata TaxID=48799 RepID=A0A915Q367_9BILA
MDFRSEVCTFARPAAMFKTLRRLHGYNLENRGLNDLSETFQNFVTRARFFSIGRLRRTWSHSAVEFLKYRRLLPMLMSDEETINSVDSVSTSSKRIRRRGSSRRRTKNEDRKILVTNVSRRVTANQLKSFFSKFGPIANCYIPSEERQQSPYATLPKKSRSSLTAYITFKSTEGAERAKNAAADELKFYDQIMLISGLSIKMKSVVGNSTETDVSSCPEDHSNNLATAASRSTTLCTLADVVSLFGNRLSLSVLPRRPLTLILSYLPPKDRIRLERVSKSFLESSIESWKSSDTLSFSSDSSFGCAFSPSNPLRNSHLKALLSRCGVHLKFLDLSGVVHLLDGHAFQIVSSSCPNLEEVNLSGLNGHWQAVRTFGEPLLNLRSVTYTDMVNVSDKTLWYLFKPVGVNMREVDLRGCRRFKGRCFRLFGDSLEKILLDGCYRLDKQSLEELCFNSPNITELGLSSCLSVSDDILSLISRNLSYLKSFALCGDCFPNLTSVGLMALLRLHSLCELSLDYNSLVSNEVLEEICANLPHLRLLTVGYAGSDVTITKEVVMKIGNLTELQTLDISSLAAITDSSLSAIACGCTKLEIIRARCCTYLGDEGVCSLAALKNLEHVDLSGCLLVTSKSIQTLLDAFPVLGHLQKLKIITVVIGGTICSLHSLRTNSSRVIVDTSDYSVSSSDATRKLLSSPSGFLDLGNNSDESSSDDEFDALTTHRSFIIDALRDAEDDSPLETQESIDEWAEREALDLGLLTK